MATKGTKRWGFWKSKVYGTFPEFATQWSRTMKLLNLTKLEWAIVICVAVVLVALLLPTNQGFWDGRFALAVCVEEAESIDRESLLLATFWTEEEAQDALDHPGVYEYGFRPLRSTDDGQEVIDVPCCGRVGAWGEVTTYRYPAFLVVEYRLEGADEASPVRKRFHIPNGRGPRSMTIQLP